MAAAPPESEITPAFGALPYVAIKPATRKAVKLYFKARGPDWVQRILIVGAPFMLAVVGAVWAGLPRDWLKFPASLGLGGVCVGFVIEYFYRKRASTAVIDEVVASELLRSQELALKRAGITAVDLRWPHGCAFRNSIQKETDKKYGGAFRQAKLGKDFQLRGTPVEYTRLNFGPQHLFIYQVAIDLTTGQPVEEVTHEVPYSEIVTVVTNSERTTKTLKNRQLAKFSKYWLPRGATLTGLTLQRDGEQTVSLRLRDGRDLPIARWTGCYAETQPSEVRVNTEATARLVGYLRELRQQPQRVQVAPRIVRH